MKKLRFPYQFNKRTSNVDFAKKDLSKLMPHFIPITEVVIKSKMLNRILKKESMIKMKDSDQ